uniref:Ribosomal protein L10a n=1 Tax=Capra hircus TaxID=9925 RepID=A0A452DME2_CAPHI
SSSDTQKTENLWAYNSQKDKHFLGTIRLKSTPRPKLSMCVLWDQQHCEEAKVVDIPHMALRKLNKSKELVKKLAKKYDPGKFPSLLTHSENMVAKVDEVKSTIQFQMKKGLCLAVTVGHLTMTDDEVVYNIVSALNFLVSLLKKNCQNIRALCLKSTCTKAQLYISSIRNIS